MMYPSNIDTQTLRAVINAGRDFFMVAEKKLKPRTDKTSALTGKQHATGTKNTAKPHHGTKTEAVLTLDRRTKREDRRSSVDRRTHDVPVAVERRTLERRAKVNRRRQIDPTTCERDYTPDEIEFMNAMDEYKRCNGRMFPTCSEILEVIQSLGYRKLPKTGDSPLPAHESPIPAPAPADSAPAVVSQGV